MIKHDGLDRSDIGLKFCSAHGWWDPCVDPRYGCRDCWRDWKRDLEEQREKREATEDQRVLRNARSALEIMYASSFCQTMSYDDFLRLLKIAKKELLAL